MNSSLTDRLVLSLIEHNSRGIVITDSDGVILYANKSVCQMTGFSSEEITGQRTSIFKSDETPEHVYQEMWSTLLAGDVWQGELLNRNRSGDHYWELIHIFPAKDKNDNVQYFLAIMEVKSRHRTPDWFGNKATTLDPLTGLQNRETFTADLQDMLKQHKNRQDVKELFLLYLNIDRFHAINQEFGYQNGDKVLIDIAIRLQNCLRRNDTIARIGADAFAIVLSEGVRGVEENIAVERILAHLREPFTLDSRQLYVTCSIGGAGYPHNGDDAESLLAMARRAMQTAKGMGGDTFHLLQRGDGQADTEQDNILHDLRQAISNDELVLFYQPQISAVTGEISGLEALLRWDKGKEGIIPPSLFIPVAEKSNIIIDIGEWVIKEAVAQIRKWRDMGLPWLKVAVNLSPSHFHRQELPEYIQHQIEAAGIEPHFLELELTESALLTNTLKVKRNIELLKSLNIKISLDDFGTGHSSLVWLSQLPVDQIKIDRSFVADITSNTINASIVTATIAMAQKLDKDVIVEGIETAAQLHFIRRHGCDFLQGFLFCKPCPAAEITDMLQRNHRWHLADTNSDTDQITILLVDDEPSIIRMMQRVFRRENYTILEASNGDEALEICAVNTVEIIISDHMMPGITGVELLGKIKKLYPDTIRFILSGQASIPTIIEAINHGEIHKYFTKPMKTEELKTAVRRACRQILTQRLTRNS